MIFVQDKMGFPTVPPGCPLGNRGTTETRLKVLHSKTWSPVQKVVKFTIASEHT